MALTVLECVGLLDRNVRVRDTPSGQIRGGTVKNIEGVGDGAVRLLFGNDDEFLDAVVRYGSHVLEVESTQ